MIENWEEGNANLEALRLFSLTSHLSVKKLELAVRCTRTAPPFELVVQTAKKSLPRSCIKACTARTGQEQEGHERTATAWGPEGLSSLGEQLSGQDKPVRTVPLGPKGWCSS